MKLISLTQGKVAMVDDSIFEYLNQWKWTAVRTRDRFYAIRVIDKCGKRVVIRMHKFVFGTSLLVDHKDNNPLNNQYHNLRIANRHQNQGNSKKRKNNLSGFKGVKKHRGGFVARIYKGKDVHLGFFTDAKKAAQAYDKAAIQYFGEFARTNAMLGLL